MSEEKINILVPKKLSLPSHLPNNLEILYDLKTHLKQSKAPEDIQERLDDLIQRQSM